MVYDGSSSRAAAERENIIMYKQGVLQSLAHHPIIHKALLQLQPIFGKFLAHFLIGQVKNR